MQFLSQNKKCFLFLSSLFFISLPIIYICLGKAYSIEEITNHVINNSNKICNNNNGNLKVTTPKPAKELFEFGKHMQIVLDRLQHPPKNCTEQKRFLVCKLDEVCGFGCAFHHVSYCLNFAAASNRTLVFRGDGVKFRYEGGWTAAFQPITNCHYSILGINVDAPITMYKSANQTDRVVELPRRMSLGHTVLPHTPLVMPTGHWGQMLKAHHVNPPAWFIGQFLLYSWSRMNKNTSDILNEAERRMSFDKGPIVGLHVRRTDKLEREGKPYSLEKYMKWAEKWFKAEEKRLGENQSLCRRIFITTDEPKVIVEARQKYGNNSGYEIFANEQHAKLAEDIENSRYTLEAYRDLLIDLHLLIKSQYVVCTYSSAMCRMVFELQQAYRGNVTESVHSLDVFFAYQYEFEMFEYKMEAIENYKAKNSEEIDLTKGDIVGRHVARCCGRLRMADDPLISGKNMRTGREGLVPKEMLRDKYNEAEYPIFD